MMLGAAALAYAARGLHVLPLRGKDPDGRLARHGVHSANALRAAIETFWRAEPSANVGIAIGVGALEHARVLDVDPKNGGDVELAKLLEQHGALPRTPEQVTGSGGSHFLFAGWPGAPLRTKLAPGVELLGPGRYFVAAPSVHPVSGRTYGWRVPFTAAPIAPAPAWLIALASRTTPRRASTPRPIASASTYARGALRSAITNVEHAKNGERNETLNRETFSVARFVAAGDLDEQLVADAMIDAAMAAGLPAREAEKTVASALSARRTA